MRALKTLVGVLACVASITLAALSPMRAPAAPRPSQSPLFPTVLAVTLISAERAAQVLKGLFPRDRITVDRQANAVIVVAPQDDVSAMRAVLAGIDVKNPSKPSLQAIQVHNADPRVIAVKLQNIYRAARFSVGPNKTILVLANPQDATQIQSVISAMDQPATTPTPQSAPAEAVKVLQARPRDVARAVAREYPHLSVAVSGSSILLSGLPDDTTKAKALITLLDVPAADLRYTQIYRLRSVDAQSVADLLNRSFRGIQIAVDIDLNAISVTAVAAVQQRVADAVAQLDNLPSLSGSGAVAAGAAPGAQPIPVGPGGISTEVYLLHAAMPGQNAGNSTSASSLAQAVTQALQGSAPDLRITSVTDNPTALILTGSSFSVRLAKDLLAKLDVAPPLVVLDTEVLELDENVARNLGLQLPQPIIGTTYSEVVPTPGPGQFLTPPFLRLQPLTRTALSLVAQLNLQVQQGNGRVLADPRVTTISGRTASIRAGDTFNVLLTTGGSAGTIATTSVQSFPTGVTLDITPIVNANNSISVTLHPVVNSVTAIINGLPQVATRDAVTTVSLQPDETLVIGGLIQENDEHQTSKIPFVGDLPLVGALFRSTSHNYRRNELIIVVTPHIVLPGAAAPPPGPALPVNPTPRPLPTLPPDMRLPTPGALFPTMTPLYTPEPAISPQTISPAAAATASPLAASPRPTPTAFAQTNVFVFGQAPANNYASSADPVRIFYASLSPTVLFSGESVTISAITTTNVNSLTLGVDGNSVQIAQLAPGKWQTTYPFNAASVPLGPATVSLTLTAYRGDGASASLPIPVSVAR